MPEAAEVRLNADFISKAFNGKKIVSIDVFKPSYFRDNTWGATIATINWFGCFIKNVTSKGKLIYGEIHLDSPEESIFYFTSSLGMTGFWTNKSLKHNHVTFYTEEGNGISINDARRFGTLQFFVNKYELDKKLDALGMDFFDSIQLRRQYESPKIQERLSKINAKTQVCEVLLNQSIFSGVGNYVKSEALYMANIHPASLWKNIPEPMIWSLLYYCKKIIHNAYEFGGASFKSFKDENGERTGTYSDFFEVYGQSKTSDGWEVLKDTFKDKRTSFFTKFQNIY